MRLIVKDVTRKALRSRSPWLKMAILTGPDFGKQNVLGSFAAGSCFVAGDALEDVVGLMTEDAVW